MALLAYFCSHFWLATPQEVLQADWQEVWHSPQPPFLALSQRLRVSKVLILFMISPPIGSEFENVPSPVENGLMFSSV